jgi:hypothetical protein
MFSLEKILWGKPSGFSRFINKLGSATICHMVYRSYVEYKKLSLIFFQDKIKNDF